jgi:membrane protease YdiL (CAAX protease family)
LDTLDHTERQGTLRRAASFIGLACLISWSLFFLARPLVPPAAGIAVYVAFMFGPLLSAVLCTALFDRRRVVEMLALRAQWNWWWLAAWLLPPLLCLAGWGVALLLPGVTPLPLAEGIQRQAAGQGLEVPPAALATLPPTWLVVIMATALGGAINTFAAIGEEAGWRGYLWTTIRPYGFWTACLVIGLVWGLWHAPVIAAGHNYGLSYPGFPWLGIATMTLFTLTMSPILGLLRDRTGSAWPAALFHGTINAVGGIFVLMQEGAHPLVGSIAGLTGALVLAIVSLVLLATGMTRRGATQRGVLLG